MSHAPTRRWLPCGLLLAAVLGSWWPAACAAQPAAPAPADTLANAPTHSTAVRQTDVMDVLNHLLGRQMKGEAQLQPTPGLSVNLLPSIGYNPAYGAFIGVSAAIGGWLGDPKTTTTSSASAGASYSTTGQTSIQLKSDFFTPGNGYDFKGDWRYLDTSQPTYGLGPVTRGQERYAMDFLLLRFYETVYVRLYQTSIFVGLGYHYSRYTNIEDSRANAGEPTPFTLYSVGYPHTTNASGLSANVLYESRDNTINATRGAYWNASVRSYNKGIGSDADWQMLWSDLRAYQRMPNGSRNTLAVWNYLWFTFGHAPYLDLPSVGWDTYGRGGRGHIQGRIRGQNEIYTEGEYRMSLTRSDLFGAVGFLNLMATTTAAPGGFGPMDPGGGVGLRMKFNKRTATNLTVDAAWAAENAGPTWFFGMQEVF